VQNPNDRGRRVTGTVPATAIRTMLTVHPRPVPNGAAERTERTVRGGSVTYFPAPNGTVRIVGVSDTGEWIAEFICREQDFDDAYVRRMERHVATKSGPHLSLLG
jgi:hypothetical protein